MPNGGYWAYCPSNIIARNITLLSRREIFFKLKPMILKWLFQHSKISLVSDFGAFNLNNNVHGKKTAALEQMPNADFENWGWDITQGYHQISAPGLAATQETCPITLTSSSTWNSDNNGKLPYQAALFPVIGASKELPQLCELNFQTLGLLITCLGSQTLTTQSRLQLYMSLYKTLKVVHPVNLSLRKKIFQ